MKSTLPCILLLLSVPALASAPPAETLESTFRNALIRSEVIGTQTELIDQAEENYKQAIGSILPNISLAGSYLQQQNVPAYAAFYPASEPLARLTATQPLFQGLREYAALRQARKLRNATEQDAMNARLSLFDSVTQNFFSILSLEKTLDDYNREVKSYQDRIQELNHRIRIGRSRESEVLTVDASLSAMYAQIEQTKGMLKVARETYAFLSGLPADTPLEDRTAIRVPPKPMQYYVDAIEARPDVKATEIRLSANEDNMQLAWGQRLPQVSLTADYYLHRFGPTQGVNWDAEVVASIPLYAGGKIDSSERVAASQIRQAELALSQARRTADEQIRSFYQTYVSDLAQAEALKKNKSVSMANLKAETHDYRLGQVTNLDVVTALIAYQESERTLDALIYTAKMDYTRLENAAARNPWVDLAHPVQPD